MREIGKHQLSSLGASISSIINKQIHMSKFVPALRFSFLTRLYDGLLSLTFPERKIKQALINQLNLAGDETILDFGCGTGTLAIMIKEQFPSVNVIGIDVDEEIIGIANKKIKAKRLDIVLQKYDGENMNVFNGKRFDKIVSSLVFHHIPTAKKRIVFKKLFELTSPDGELYIADFGKPKTLYTIAAFGLLRRFDGIENTAVNARGLLPKFIEGGGFAKVEILQSFNTAFGLVDLIKAKR